jgi:hypothetical protein
MLATVVLPLLHDPPVVASINVVDAPEQIVKVPDIIPGNGFTVTVELVLQPPEVKVIEVVPPLPTPVTAPELFTVAAVVLLLLHVPGPVASLRLVIDPEHTLNVPVIVAGTGFTVTVVALVQPDEDV